MTAPSILLAEQARRFAELDKLLPPPVLPAGGEPIGALERQGRPLVGVLHHEHHHAGRLSSLWSARASQYLHPLVADGAELEPLLARWRELLDGRRDPGRDSACVLTWPSRDTAGTAVLLRHGFAPLTVLAVRERAAEQTTAADDGVSVREACHGDLPVLEELAMAEQRYAADVGAGILRDDAAQLKAQSLRLWLDGGSPVLIAERDGRPLGMAQYRWARLAEDSRPRLLPDGDWGYVNCLSVAPGRRSCGVGRTLMGTVRARLAAVGTRGTYLYYNPANPLSSVFWPRQGYRPLWTIWEARPTSALR